ncbi:methyltransferase family protein [Aquicoccus sp. G2-2]|uniref:methyltransferase family protein n=1 Tax=Aquicoccus sp. G2-2 TaxID=3092120 RepID=UPI002ADF74F0|nr:isoprenylcysteine carboxylmethyltransferase family protein [Aquicoccus sp. G2-2]MEA1113555.1 isoprenylcysteine carboxylmethyltransferase family protein [Aquicoccus sp. G2-2]
MKWIDLPPVWLLGFLGLAWAQGHCLSLGLSFGGGMAAKVLGGLLVAGGVLLMGLAVFEMARQRTTVIPHREASALVQTGIFARTRNPIYLGDALVLSGAILYWGAVLSLALIPVFVWWVTRHFIVPEEHRLGRKFRADFARYCQKTRRWV